MTKEKIFNVTRAVVLGHAVADALGVPVEFKKREELDENPVTDMMGYGTYDVPAGSWSDDTTMAICALDVLKTGEVDYVEIMENFVSWVYFDAYTPESRLFDIGTSCKRAIFRYSSNNSISPTECGGKDDWCNGNGSLMRIHTFVLYCHFVTGQDTESVIRDGSSLTHRHERSVLGCQIYTHVLNKLIENPNKNSVSEALSEAYAKYRDNPEISAYERLFDGGFAALDRSLIKSTGYVVDTLEAAIWCLLTTDSYEECVLRAVNLGADTDTVAAVAGGLAGALYGYEAIPEKWLSTLIRKDYIEDMCLQASEMWAYINNPEEQ